MLKHFCIDDGEATFAILFVPSAQIPYGARSFDYELKPTRFTKERHREFVSRRERPSSPNRNFNHDYEEEAYR